MDANEYQSALSRRLQQRSVNQSGGMMYTLGLDIGFGRAATGGALISFDAEPALIRTFRLHAHCGGDWQRRADDVLMQLKDHLALEILPYYPRLLLAYELPHVERNAQTALRLADLGGGVRGLAAAYGLACIGVQSAEAKIGLTGDHTATKEMMQHAARAVFGRALSEHEADACGVALAGEAIVRRAQLVKRVVR